MIGCQGASSLILAALARRASEADLLELETHLDGCARCAAEHASLSVLRQLRGWEPPSLSDFARERARRAVIASGQSAVGLGAPVTRRGRTVGFIVLGGLAVAAIALVFVGRSGDRVVGGDVTVDGARTVAIGGRAELFSVGGGAILVGGAAVDLRAGSALGWRSAERTVELRQGAVTVDVAPGQARRFRVATARFVVEVIGTHFTVELDGVHTDRGTVHVLAPDGALLASVGAGRTWRLPAPGVSVAPPHRRATEASPIVTSSARPSPVAAPMSLGVAPPTVARHDNLSEARRAISAGQSERARTLLRPLLRLGASAEAHSLLAESFLVEGRYNAAVDAYRAVALDFDGTPQAESALFAIAQLETESARSVEAARALTRYLARYPHGRFAREAQQRLDRLGR